MTFESLTKDDKKLSMYGMAFFVFPTNRQWGCATVTGCLRKLLWN